MWNYHPNNSHLSLCPEDPQVEREGDPIACEEDTAPGGQIVKFKSQLLGKSLCVKILGVRQMQGPHSALLCTSES